MNEMREVSCCWLWRAGGQRWADTLRRATSIAGPKRVQNRRKVA